MKKAKKMPPDQAKKPRRKSAPKFPAPNPVEVFVLNGKVYVIINNGTQIEQITSTLQHHEYMYLIAQKQVDISMEVCKEPGTAIVEGRVYIIQPYTNPFVPKG